MPTYDLRSMIGSVINFTRSRANQVCTAPCDGFVLKMHYKWTFYAFIATCLGAFCGWYIKSFIFCVSHFNASLQIRVDYVNICLSYPYVEVEGEPRRYITFYRWVQWMFLLLAGVYYIPRKVSKTIENNKLKRLLEDVAQMSNRYNIYENQSFQCVDMYMTSHLHTHNHLYYKYIALNVLALIIDICTLHFLDFVLQGKFLLYGFKSYPFERDPKTFKDYMSSAFPPFVSCEIGSANQLTAKRTEVLGCHLTLMEVYEKIFFFVWGWLILLMIITSIYIVFTCFMMIPSFRYYILRPAKPVYRNVEVKSIIDGINRNCEVGDIYVLYRLKQHLSHATFYEILLKLSRDRFWEIPPLLPLQTRTEARNLPKRRTQVQQNDYERNQIQYMQTIPTIINHR